MTHLERVLPILRQAERLGHEVRPDGTELIGRTPHVAPQAWLHIVFRPLSQQEIGQLEDELGGGIRAGFRQFLSEANGLSLFSDAISVFGLRTSYARDRLELYQPYSLSTPNREERLPNTPEGALFFGSYRWDGSLLYLTEDDRVHRCSRDSAVTLTEWPNLSEFLVAEVSRLSGLYDSDGRIDGATPTIPSRQEAHVGWLETFDEAAEKVILNRPGFPGDSVR